MLLIARFAEDREHYLPQNNFLENLNIYCKFESDGISVAFF